MDHKRSLKLDEALLTVVNENSGHISFWNQISECFKCPLERKLSIRGHHNESVVLDTTYSNEIQVRNRNEEVICDIRNFTFNDHGLYRLHVNKTDCDIESIYDGRDNRWPLLTLLALIVVASFLYYLFIRLRKGRNNPAAQQVPNEPSVVPESSPPKKTRVVCVDAFRGITIMLMIFVNNRGGGYIIFNHSPWFGYTIADCVFPFFMFIMGISIAFSLWSQVIRTDSNFKVICIKIVRRSVILFALGLMINSIGETNLLKLRIPGVLQRFAVCYLFVALMHALSLRKFRRQSTIQVDNGSWRRHFIDIYPYYSEWLGITSFLIAYFGLTFAWQYNDNCPPGYQGPGGWYMNASHPNCTGGAAAAIDEIVFGKDHLYKNPRLHSVFHTTMTNDPEGLLGTTTSIFLVVIGLQVGKTFIAFRTHKERIIRWFVYCVILGALTLLTTETKLIPVCKNLWSFSYVTFSGFLALLVLIGFYALIDVTSFWKKGTPLHMPGMNSIFLYCGHEIGHDMLPWYFDVDEASHAWLLFRACFTTFLWFLISVLMAKKRIFINI